MTPDVLKNVFASRFKADVVSVLEEKHYCLQLNNEMFLVFSTSVKKKKKKSTDWRVKVSVASCVKHLCISTATVQRALKSKVSVTVYKPVVGNVLIRFLILSLA